MWFVYIIECRDGTYYTGISNDVEARIKKHNSGKGAKYTRGRGPVTLVWSERARDRSSASKREYNIKKKTRDDKIRLIMMSSMG